MKKILLLMLLFVNIFLFSQKSNQLSGSFFNESRESFNKRMEWFGEAKLGMFIHLGLYSQLEGSWKGKEMPWFFTEWIWSKIPKIDSTYKYQEYLDLTKKWNPKNFDADKITDLALALGMKYITITTKHHEGFCLWPSKYTDFDIENTPMKGRDLIGELSAACKKKGLKFGAYYSFPDAYYVIKELEEIGEIKENQPASFGDPKDPKKYFIYIKNQLKELIDNYDPDLIWFDGDWTRKLVTNERSYELYEYLRGLKSEILINERCFSRFAKNIPKKDFFCKEGNKITSEELELQNNPDTKRFYEFCTSTQRSWGFDDRKFHESNRYYTSPLEMLEMYAMMRKVGGNFLLNFGPKKDGSFDEGAIKVAREFYQMTKIFDKKEDCSEESIKEIKKETKFSIENYRNLNHYFFSDKKKYRKLKKTAFYKAQITEAKEKAKKKKKRKKQQAREKRKNKLVK